MALSGTAANGRDVARQRTVRLRLLRRQRAFLASAAPELMYAGAWGAGKTRALCIKAIAIATRYPGTTVGICRKKLVDCRMTTMRTFFDEVCPPELIASYQKSERVVTLRAGGDGAQRSRVVFFGLVNSQGQSFNVRSLTLGAAGADEAVELDEREWDELGGRLRQPTCGLRQLFGATNPAGRGHWIYRRFIAAPTPGVHHIIQTNAFENPFLPADYLERIQRLQGRYRDRYVLGKWVDFEGLVYDNFDPLVHQITWEQFAERWGAEMPGPRAIPASWPRFGAMDFGYTNPFVFQWWAQSPDGELYRYREIFYSHRLVADHAQHAKALHGSEPPFRAIWADHDAEGRKTFEAETGWSTSPARKEVAEGIQAVYRRLQPDPKTGRPSLFFIRDALVEQDPYLVAEDRPWCTEMEMQAYAYPRGQDGRPVKEEPVKVNDHGCDAARYLVFSEEAGSGSGVFSFMRERHAARKRAGE